MSDVIKCPKCKSTNLHVGQQGFSTGKAVAGLLTVGTLGILAGNIGRDKIKVTCLDCGKTFNPLEEKKRKEQQEFEMRVIERNPKLGCLSYIAVGVGIALLIVPGVPFWVSIVLILAGLIVMANLGAKKNN